jgi:hypothetical protein
LKTNAGRGVAGEKKSEYSIIHTGRSIPQLSAEEHGMIDEAGPLRYPVKIIPSRKWEKLDQKQRLHWTKVYEVHYDVKAMQFGKIHPHSQFVLEYEYRNLATRSSNRQITPGIRQATRTTLDDGVDIVTRTIPDSKELAAEKVSTRAQSMIDIAVQLPYGIADHYIENDEQIQHRRHNRLCA